MNRNYDIEELDRLYAMRVINKQEYLHYISHLQDILLDRIGFLDQIIEDAEAAEGDYNPFVHYGFGFSGQL